MHIIGSSRCYSTELIEYRGLNGWLLTTDERIFSQRGKVGQQKDVVAEAHIAFYAKSG